MSSDFTDVSHSVAGSSPGVDCCWCCVGGCEAEVGSGWCCGVVWPDVSDGDGCSDATLLPADVAGVALVR